MPKSDQPLFINYEETTSREETLHDQTSESIRRRLLNLPQQPSFSTTKKSVNKTNSDGGTNGNNPLQKLESDDKKESDNLAKRKERDKNYERNRQSKPDLNKNHNRNDDSKNNSLTNKIKEASKNQIKRKVKGQGKRLAREFIHKGSKKVAEKGVKQATKAAAKAVARLAKRLAVKAIALIGKAIGALIASIGLPTILLAAAIVILMVLLMTLSTISMGTGQSVDFLGKEAKELRAYIVELCDKSIDASKPEQVPYRLPEELLAAVVQLDSWKEKNDKEPDVQKMKRLLDKFYNALKPSFETEEFTEWTKTRTRSCEEVEKDKNGKETGKCLRYSEWKETVQKRTVRRLTKIVAWNGTATFTYQEEESGWSSGETSQTKTMAYVIKDQNFEYDFTKLDQVLTSNGYGEQDKKMFEYFYESATGVPMHYIDWLNGMAIDYGGGMGQDFCFNGTVIPGKGVPPQYMPIYLSAQQKYGIPWYTLAAIHFIETTFSTNVSVSTAGAVGHTQFMPLTWIGWAYPGGNRLGNANIPKEILTDPAMIKKYGGYGTDADGDGKADPWDLMDAIHTTAKYLRASGYLENPRKAILAYNHSEKYVHDVMSAAERFKNEATLKPAEATTSETSTSTTTDSLPSGGACGGSGEIPPISSGDFTRPAMGVITSGFGQRGSEFHYGIDIAKPGTVPVVAAADGVVSRSYLSSSYGNCIMIVHNIHGVQYETVYAHLRNRAVSEGKKVKKGEFLGYMGSTGQSTGQHLHFEVHKGRWNINKSNAINPLLVIPAK